MPDLIYTMNDEWPVGRIPRERPPEPLVIDLRDYGVTVDDFPGSPLRVEFRDVDAYLALRDQLAALGLQRR